VCFLVRHGDLHLHGAGPGANGGREISGMKGPYDATSGFEQRVLGPLAG
jgi:hypothetical protein